MYCIQTLMEKCKYNITCNFIHKISFQQEKNYVIVFFVKYVIKRNRKLIYGNSVFIIKSLYDTYFEF